MAQEGLKLSLALSQPAPVLTWFQIWGNVCAGPEAPVQLLERAGLTSWAHKAPGNRSPRVLLLLRGPCGWEMSFPALVEV